MKSELSRLQVLIDQMERSAAKVAMLEQAIQIADAIHDLEVGFTLRKQLAKEATFTGFPEKALVAVIWNLAQVDRDPKRFPEIDMLWEYKWVVLGFRKFPQISRLQIEEALANLARRLERNGANLRPVHKLRVTMAHHFGNREQVLALLPLWKKSQRDAFSDCPACDRHDLVSIYFFLGQARRALQVARPILDGRESCFDVPRITYAEILVPLLRLDRREEAAEYHRLGYPLFKQAETFTYGLPEHLLYLVLIQDMTKAVKLFESRLRLALASSSPLYRYSFWHATLFLFQRLRRAPKLKRKFRLPDSFPLWNEQGTYDLLHLMEWFQNEARALALQFDARSGTNFRMKELRELEQLEEMIQPISRDT